MKITRIHIPQLKGCKPIELFFERGCYFPPTFPIGGVNGSGKTRLLQLVFTLLTCWQDPYKFFLLQTAIETSISMSDSDEQLVAEIDIWDEVDEWDGGHEYQLKFIVRCHEGKVIGVNKQPDILRQISQQVYLLTHYLEPPCFIDVPLNLTKSIRMYASMVEGAKVLLPRFINYEDLYPSLTNWRKLSTGQAKYYSLEKWVEEGPAKGAIVLLDNPDIFLHPDWQYQLVGALHKVKPEETNQYLIATHSYSLCEALTPAHVRVIE